MLRFLPTTLCGLLLAVVANAAALPVLESRTVTEVTATDLAALAPFTRFAGAAYCSLEQLKAWSCSMCSLPSTLT